MLAALAPFTLGDAYEPSCLDVRTVFKDSGCCDVPDQAQHWVKNVTDVCPSVALSLTYEASKGKWNYCPTEEYPKTYSASNPLAPGYSGCVSEDDAIPCGWYDYYDYDASTNTCTQTHNLQTALQIVRGGSPTMSKDMIRLTGSDYNPPVTFAALPMSYPGSRSPTVNPEVAELEAKWKEFMTYFGSQLDMTNFIGYPNYGAEQGMVASVATKVLEMASTTCNRDFYAYLEAPAYGYNWGQAVIWAEQHSSQFYDGAECPCAAAGTCKDKNTITINQRGWAPNRYPSLPWEADALGVYYQPNSTSPNSPWFQTNVIPGNPIGRFNECVAPEDKCLCDGVYWYPAFLAPGTVMKDFKCYTWAFSITKIYSAQLRAGMFFTKNTIPAAVEAAGRIAGNYLNIANGLYSHLQLYGQIQLMNDFMSKPASDPTSWIGALGVAQREKWDLMWDAFATCEAAGVMKIAAETTKYNGAYIFSHMMPQWFGYSNNIGSSSSDFFKTVVGIDHFNYNWGWRGEDAAAYGIGEAVTNLDFHRTHLFRAYDLYAEEARRMKLVCGDFDAKVTNEFFSVNEWVAVRSQDIERRRKLGSSAPKSLHSRALEIQEAVPRMDIVKAIKMAKMTDPTVKGNWEYGMPADMEGVN